MEIAPDLLERIVEHARRDAPNECCGLVIARDGRAVEVVEMENLQASPFRFEVDGAELLRRLDEAEDRGDAVGAIYHSHTRSAPEPSQTDVTFAAGWPGVEWIIVGLADGEPEVRTWRIEGPEVTEV
jgi:proteasome lid subunit RPN8/RPN11